MRQGQRVAAQRFQRRFRTALQRAGQTKRSREIRLDVNSREYGFGACHDAHLKGYIGPLKDCIIPLKGI